MPKWLGKLELVRGSIVLYFIRNFRAFSRIVLTVGDCCLEFDFGL